MAVAALPQWLSFGFNWRPSINRLLSRLCVCNSLNPLWWRKKGHRRRCEREIDSQGKGNFCCWIVGSLSPVFVLVIIIIATWFLKVFCTHRLLSLSLFLEHTHTRLCRGCEVGVVKMGLCGWSWQVDGKNIDMKRRAEWRRNFQIFTCQHPTIFPVPLRNYKKGEDLKGSNSIREWNSTVGSDSGSSRSSLRFLSVFWHSQRRAFYGARMERTRKNSRMRRFILLSFHFWWHPRDSAPAPPARTVTFE